MKISKEGSTCILGSCLYVKYKIFDHCQFHKFIQHNQQQPFVFPIDRDKALSQLLVESLFVYLQCLFSWNQFEIYVVGFSHSASGLVFVLISIFIKMM